MGYENMTNFLSEILVFYVKQTLETINFHMLFYSNRKQFAPLLCQNKLTVISKNKNADQMVEIIWFYIEVLIISNHIIFIIQFYRVS